MQHKVFVTEPIHEVAQAMLAGNVAIDVGELSLPREEIKRRVADATVILNKTDPIKFDRELIDAAPQLVHIARHGSGYDNVDVAYATSKGISVSYVSGANTVAIAEYTVGLMLLATRKLVDAVEKSRAGNPPRSQFLGIEACGKTFGIVGLGAIGREVVKRVRAFGMDVLAYHPRPQGKDFTGVETTLVPFDELLARSDVVSIHIPLNAETRGLFGRRELLLMKPTAYLLNLARGGIVDETALAEVLRARRLAGAVLDVLADEPVKATEPLLACPNCIVLPHIAAMTTETQARIALNAAENVLAFCRGDRPRYLANPEVWPVA
ncbi:hydroxyacid dehydrogenase [Xanthobacteraceae bacterium Astr-EGSB]|uniref:hydroxyacid dehydrogenase n=1 Tax=Astrobacterium formosum TaxID=3069710 RepID=UPI0027B80A11|nr:hydroxyacid dehydrogenase [Xanthobacteraceae bacterium Astr-EGSB]